MLYLKIDPKKVSETFIDFIVADVTAFAQASKEASVELEVTELESVSATLSATATTATASSGAGQAVVIDVMLTDAVATETALLGAP